MTVKAVLTAPALVTAPALSGTGKIGTAVTVAAGNWSGNPVPTTSLQWRSNGVAIAGATAASYTPAAADDGKDLTCLVSATSSAGTAQAATAALKVSYAAPTAKAGALADVSYDQNSGAKTVATAAAFTGAGLSYAVTGAGASINAATGVVTLSTTTLVSAVAVTVTASNSGGTATSSFKVTVKASATGAPPPALQAADWSIGAVSLSTGKWTPRFKILKAGLAPQDVRWMYSGLNPDVDYEPTLAPDADGWWRATSKATPVHEVANGTTWPLCIFYRLSADGPGRRSAPTARTPTRRWSSRPPRS